MAVGDRKEKRIAGPISLTTGSATIASPLAGRQFTVKQIIFTNTSGVEALVYLGIGPSTAPGNRIFSALPIAVNDVVVWDTALVVEPQETITAYADRNGVNVTIVGWEKEV